MKLFKLRSNSTTDKTTEFSARLGSSITIQPNARIGLKSIFINGSIRDYLVLEADQTFQLFSSTDYYQNISIPSGNYTSASLTKQITDKLNTSYYMNVFAGDGGVYAPKISTPIGNDANETTFLGIDWNCSLDRGNLYKCAIAFNCNNSILSPVYKTVNITNNDGVYTSSVNPNLYDNKKYAISQTPISRGCNYVGYTLNTLGGAGGNTATDFKAIFGIYDGSKRTSGSTILRPQDYDCCFAIRRQTLRISIWNNGVEDLLQLQPQQLATAGMRFYILPNGDTYRFVIISANGLNEIYNQTSGTKIFTNTNIYSAFTINDNLTSIGNIQTVSSPFFAVENNIVSSNYTPEFSIDTTKVEGSATRITINFGEPVNSQALQNLLGYLQPELTINASSFTFIAQVQVDKDQLEDVSVAIQNLDINSYDTSKSLGFKCATIMTVDSLQQTASAAGAFSYDVPTVIMISMNNDKPISLSSFLVRITSQNIPINIPSGVCSITVLIDDSEK
jgi:hypothetical protein